MLSPCPTLEGVTYQYTQIPNAGITENGRGVCSGDLVVVNGKPVAPKLATLEVNLTGVFYSE